MTFTPGAFLGSVRIADAHYAHRGCCESKWAERPYRRADGSVQREIVHLALADAHRFDVPLPARGRLGLWSPSAEEVRLIDGLSDGPTSRKWRAVTVREPWASAIVDGHKDVENRSAGFTQNYRGLVLIHSAQTWSDRGTTDARLVAAYGRAVLEDAHDRLWP